MRSYEFSKIDQTRVNQRIEKELDQADVDLIFALGKVNRLRSKLDKMPLSLTNNTGE